MTPLTLALFFSALLLQEAAASPRARCFDDLCCFQRSLDFKAAQETCKESTGQMVQYNSTVLVKVLFGFEGVFWLHGDPDCIAVSVGSGSGVMFLSKPCQNTLDGFCCTYDSSEVCGFFQGSGNTSVTYSTSAGFDLSYSDTFPPGTLALVTRPGAHYPDSKHLCMSGWNQAPWSCEVLQGGCDHRCNKVTKTCSCPAAQSVHHNNISCTPASPPPDSSPPSEIRGCPEGYRLATDGKSCVDLDECADEKNPCQTEGEECVNLDGGYECGCPNGFEKEDGACVNVSICKLCEHMRCEKISGVYLCMCREGFKVSDKDPTRCEQVCDQKDCPAICHRNPDLKKKDMQQCFCPEGFVLDLSNGTATCHDIDECEAQKLCDHECENLPGGFRCVCKEGYTMQKEKCVRLKETEEDEDEEDASGSPPSPPAPATTAISLQPAALPPYIKAGSVLGITVFLALCAGLLVCVVRYSARRCRTFNLNSLKHPDIDIFYLQQVTTETYKRLSFDKQIKNEAQRV